MIRMGAAWLVRYSNVVPVQLTSCLTLRAEPSSFEPLKLLNALSMSSRAPSARPLERNMGEEVLGF